MGQFPKINTEIEDPTWVSKVEVYSVTTQIYCIIKIAGNHKKRINRKKTLCVQIAAAEYVAKLVNMYTTTY